MAHACKDDTQGRPYLLFVVGARGKSTPGRPTFQYTVLTVVDWEHDWICHLFLVQRWMHKIIRPTQWGHACVPVDFAIAPIRIAGMAIMIQPADAANERIRAEDADFDDKTRWKYTLKGKQKRRRQDKLAVRKYRQWLEHGLQQVFLHVGLPATEYRQRWVADRSRCSYRSMHRAPDCRAMSCSGHAQFQRSTSQQNGSTQTEYKSTEKTSWLCNRHDWSWPSGIE